MIGSDVYVQEGVWDPEKAQKIPFRTIMRRDYRMNPSRDSSISTLTSLANLASTLWNKGCWKEAEKLEARVHDSFKSRQICFWIPGSCP